MTSKFRTRTCARNTRYSDNFIEVAESGQIEDFIDDPVGGVGTGSPAIVLADFIEVGESSGMETLY